MTFEQLCKSDTMLATEAWLAFCELVRRDREDGGDRAFTAWWDLAAGIPDAPPKPRKPHIVAREVLDAIRGSHL